MSSERLAAESPETAKVPSSSSDAGNSSPSPSPSPSPFEYFGWVYHLGTNSIGHEYCHLRFLYLRGKFVSMYKRDPHEHPNIKPIRKGLISYGLMVEELGRRKVNEGDAYVLRLYNRLDETKKGEIACASAGDARKWMEAFEQAKQQAEYDLVKGSSRHLLNSENELNLEGHRPRVRAYAHGLRKLIRIGKGPEFLLRQSLDLGSTWVGTYHEGDSGDIVEANVWKCVDTINGIRIFENMTEPKGAKSFLVKSVGVVNANADTVFEVILSLDKHKRYEWDTITSDLELAEEENGHCDVVYGAYNSKYLSRSSKKSDFVFSRQWFCSQDGSYTILQFPSVHKKHPPRHGYRRIQINPSTWEIRRLNTSQTSNVAKCLVTQILEIYPSFWDRWKIRHNFKFEKIIPFPLLCQVAGLREYFEANPQHILKSPPTIVSSSHADIPTVNSEFEDSEMKEEFYDALYNNDLVEDEDSDDELEISKGGGSMRFRNISWAIASLTVKKSAALAAQNEFDTSISPVRINLDQFHGSLHQAKTETDMNCWSSPNGQGYMIRGKTYLKDFTKVMGGDPLLKLIAVDWFKTENRIDGIALHPKCLVQSEAVKNLPFIMLINLQVPAKPNYNLVLYYGAERPVSKESLLGRFVDGTDAFRNSRFKLIPSIVEGYWMVKRAVGTKACLLGKAVTCRYLRQDNFLEIDVDIGSSSVAKSIIGLVLGYVTGIVVDLAILIEGKEEHELPEFILGTVRLNHLKPDSAVEL